MKKNIIIAILMVLLGISLCYIGYDLIMKKDSNSNNQENNNSLDLDVDYRFTSMSIQDYNALAKDINQETGREDDGKIKVGGNLPYEYQLVVIDIRNILTDKLNYLPILNNGGKVTDLTDKEKANYLWWYVYDKKLEGNKISKEDTNDIFKYNFNIEDYKVKPGSAGGGHITETNDAYEIYQDGPDGSDKSIVNRIEYDKETKEVKAYFESYMIGGSGGDTGMKSGEGTAIFKVYYENKEGYKDFYFALDRIIANK